MLEFPNGGRLVQRESELPLFLDVKDLFIDFETTSRDPKQDSLDPYHTCYPLGICVAADDSPAYYIPVGHQSGNVDATAWLIDLVNASKNWIGHNAKYDMHVYARHYNETIPCNVIDTLTFAKIIDSDRGMRGGYGLDALSKGWLFDDISQYEKAFAHFLIRNKDYGAVPQDIMGEYGCQDVITLRRLYKYMQAKLPEQCKYVWSVEQRLTEVLFTMERNGMCVNRDELRAAELMIIKTLLTLEEELEAIVGYGFRPNVNDDCFRVLCNTYGLPVLAWTNEGEEGKPHNPSFDKHALVQYANHPYAPQDVVSRIIKYRKLNTLNSLFVSKYQTLNIDNILHPSYNQCLRTGRMSCKDPNMQQLSSDAKKLIHPRPGNSFLRCDYSQIEFRIIAHYIQDQDAIAAYNKDPDTDFHQWVADMCGISRKPAKTVNFMMGYGGGKETTVEQLSTNMEVSGQIKEIIDKAIEEGKLKPEDSPKTFEYLCKKRAEKIYDSYHNALPSLKPTSRKCANTLRARGFVFNHYGRHRHIPPTLSRIAFNSICQSTAADIMKERTVAVAEMCEGTDIKLVASVHDELLLEGPTEVIEDERTIKDIVRTLEAISLPLRVPIRCSCGVSSKSWAAAAKVERTIDAGESRRLDHLK